MGETEFMVSSVSGDLMTWHKVTVDFTGPESFSEESDTFRDYRLDVVFTNEDTGEVFVIPGFFAADGDAENTGATSGNVWRANFNPPSEGNWTYEASFRTGEDIAATTFEQAPNAGSAVEFIDGESGSITIAETDKTGEDFRAKGLIKQDEGTHFLQHQGDGDYFIRGGPGIPENFLATPDIDGTEDGRFEFEAHLSDFNPGDPTWADGRGEGIIGAVNYFADQGQNTIYFLTNTSGGDGRDVSPWTLDAGSVDEDDPGLTEAEIVEFSTYDVSKLSQWDIVFDHMDEQGIYKNLLFQETENDQLLDGGTDVEGSSLSVERLVYMREMIARFGHNNGIQWNLGEENTNTDQQRIDMSNYVKSVDAYDHLVVVHNVVSQIDNIYGGLLGVESFDGTSIQQRSSSIRDEIEQFRDLSADAGDPWVLAWDEDAFGSGAIEPGDNNFDDPNQAGQREAFWSTLLANGSGGNVYIRGNGQSLDQNLDDFTGFQALWTWIDTATSFMNTFVPFWDMEQADGLTTNENDFVLAKDGEYYLVYLPIGEADAVNLNLSGQDGESFDVLWYNPRTGGDLISGGQVNGGETVQIDSPPADSDEDWVLLVRNSELPDVPVIPPIDSDPPVETPIPPVEEPVADIEPSFFLINADTDEIVQEIDNGDAINLVEVGAENYSIQIVPNADIGSVQISFDGETRVENSEPYSLFTDQNGDFVNQGDDTDLGEKTLEVTFFSGSDATGTVLGSSTLDFDLSSDGVEAEPDNIAPVANDDSATLDENGSVTIDVLANDTDADGDTLTLVSVGTANNGTVEVVGDSVRYTPDQDFFGEDVITYTISDNQGGTSSSEIIIEVEPVQEEPEPTSDDVAFRLFLADTDTDETLLEITSDTTTIGFDVVEGRNVTVFAVAEDGADVGSVRLEMTGSDTRIENVTPFVLSGNRGDDYFEGNMIPSGVYDINITAFSESNAGGDVIGMSSLQIEVADQSDEMVSEVEPGVTPESSLQFFLADAQTNETLSELTNGSSVDQSILEDRNLTIFVLSDDEDIESIQIFTDGTLTQTENIAPYALFGDNGGDFLSGSGLQDNSFDLTFAAYDDNDGEGNLIEEIDLSIQITDETFSSSLYDL